MEISVDQVVSNAMHAKSNMANSRIAVALAAKQLDAQKAAGDAVVEMLTPSNVQAGTRGRHVNILV